MEFLFIALLFGCFEKRKTLNFFCSFLIIKNSFRYFRANFLISLRLFFPVFKRQATYKETEIQKGKKLTTNTLSQKSSQTHTNKHLTSVVVLWNISDAVSAHQKMFFLFISVMFLALTHSLSQKMCVGECWFWSVWQKVFFLIIDFSIFHLFVLFSSCLHTTCVVAFF